MFPALRALARDPEGKVLLVAFTTVVAIGTVVYTILEHWSPLDSLYFCIVTLATVGFGDLHPTTELSRAFTIVYILAGIGILSAFVSEVTRYRHPRMADLVAPPVAGPASPSGGASGGGDAAATTGAVTRAPQPDPPA